MRQLVRILIRGYQIFLSPALAFLAGAGAGCRFQPTCSAYCLEAVETHGVVRGLWLGVKRLARCAPWGGEGHDPVPPRDRKQAVATCRGAHSGRLACE